MNIVNIIQRYPPAVGGAELWGQEVSQYLAGQGHAVRVCTLDVNHEEEFWYDPPDDGWTLAFGPFGYDGRVAVRRYHRSLPIPVMFHVYERVLDRWLNIYFYGPHSGHMYAQLWREIRPADVVFLHALPHPHNHVAFLIAKLLRKKIVSVPHFHPGHPFYERRINYWLLRHCDAVLADTTYEKTYLHARGVAAEKLYVTGVGVHLERYQADNLEATRRTLAQQHGLQANERVVTFIGRKVPEKGIADLMAAIKVLRLQLPVRLFLVGPGLAWFHDLYADLSPEDRTYIIDLGLVSHQEKVNILHLSDLLALPSKHEAFGIVFLEAWACGIPVVGSREGAIPSVVGQEGLVCTFGDTDDLARTLKQALADPQTLREMGARGQAKVQTQYTWEAIGQTAEQALRAAYGGKRKMLFVTGQQAAEAALDAAVRAQIRQFRQHDYAVQVFVVAQQNMAEDQSLLSRDDEDGIPVYRMCLSPAVAGLGGLSAASAQIRQMRQIRDQFAEMLDDFAPDGVYCHGLLGVSAGLCQVVHSRRMPLFVSCLPAWGMCSHQLRAAAEEARHDCLSCPDCLPFLVQDGESEVPLRLRQDFVALQLETALRVLTPESGASEQIEIASLFSVILENPTALSVRPTAAVRSLVCIGHTFSAPARQALGQIEQLLDQSAQPWRILMAEWLDEAQLKQATLVWVVDQDVDFEQVWVGLRNQLPLLVPDQAPELAQLCVSRECGLSYRDAHEAVGCVQRLGADASLCKTLGMNGFRLFYEQASGQPSSKAATAETVDAKQ
jgi:glycosyltransferase involved in cell wall biosynthesis